MSRWWIVVTRTPATISLRVENDYLYGAGIMDIIRVTTVTKAKSPPPTSTYLPCVLAFNLGFAQISTWVVPLECLNHNLCSVEMHSYKFLVRIDSNATDPASHSTLLSYYQNSILSNSIIENYMKRFKRNMTQVSKSNAKGGVLPKSAAFVLFRSSKLVCKQSDHRKT